MALAICVGLLVMLVGCGSSSENELIGKWKNKDEHKNPQYVEFKDDGTCIEFNHKEDYMEDGEEKQEMEYEVSDDTIKFEGGDSVSYSIVGDELQLNEGEEPLLFEKE